MSNITEGSVYVQADIPVNRGTQLLEYRPDLDADRPWHHENIKELDVKTGAPANYEYDDIIAYVEDGRLREATPEELELVRGDTGEYELADGFEYGDIYVDIEEFAEGGFEEGAMRFIYLPDYHPDRPWVYQNPDMLTRIFRGVGPHSFTHEGDIKDRIDSGELRKVTDEELEYIKDDPDNIA